MASNQPAPSAAPPPENKQKKFNNQQTSKFGNSIKAKPEYKYLNRDRLIKRMDKFYGPLNQQELLPSF